MNTADQPQIYLVTPPELELARFADQLAAILDSTNIACLRLALTSTVEDTIARAADQLRETCHARDVAIVIDQHYRMVQRLGLDGCHLQDNPKLIRDVRKDLGADAIIGSYCGTSRHNGLAVGEAGADYVAFGPVVGSALGDGSVAETALFTWWSEMIEVPVIAEGGLNVAKIETLAPVTDFFAIGPEIWPADDPAAALKTLLTPLS